MSINFINNHFKDSSRSYYSFYVIPTIEVVYCGPHNTYFSFYSSQIILNIKWLFYTIRFTIKRLKSVHNRPSINTDK